MPNSVKFLGVHLLLLELESILHLTSLDSTHHNGTLHFLEVFLQDAYPLVFIQQIQSVLVNILLIILSAK